MKLFLAFGPLTFALFVTRERRSLILENAKSSGRTIGKIKPVFVVSQTRRNYAEGK